MLKFSIKNAFRKKTIAILASVGVGFGLMLVFVLGAFNAGVKAQFNQSLAATIGQVQVTEKSKQIPANNELPLDIPKKIFNTENLGEKIVKYNVETQAPFYFTDGFNGEMENDNDLITIKGLNTTLDEEWKGATTKIEKGENFEAGKKELIIDSRLAEVAKFDTNVGNELEIALDVGDQNITSFEIVGIYTQEDSGAPDFVAREYYFYTSIETMWDLLDEANETSNIYTAVLLQFDVQNNEETNKYVDIINEASEEGAFKPTYLDARSLGAFFESLEETFQILDAFTGVIGLITFLAGGMAIIVTNLMSVSSRLKEFAILKATGWKNRHIFQNVIYESLTLGGLGAAIGLGLGFLIILLLRASPLGIASAVVTPGSVIQVVSYALGLGVVGGLYPAIKAARVRPVKVLKGE